MYDCIYASLLCWVLTVYTKARPVYTGILIQILIQIGYVYTEANWIQSHVHLSHVDCDPDLNPDSGPGARVSVCGGGGGGGGETGQFAWGRNLPAHSSFLMIGT